MGDMSTVWMRMPGQTWLGAAASFVAMWTVMMVAMMLPSVLPALSGYRVALGRNGATRRWSLTALVGTAYFGAWAAFGAALFPFGALVTAVVMRSPSLARLAPVAVGVIVLIAGAFQFTASKARYLACCRAMHWRGRTVSTSARGAWRDGVRLAVHCACCGAGLTGVLLSLGVMDLRVMSIVAIATAIERLAPNGAQAARTIGVVIVAAGLMLIARATI